jgi:hypothetical protein
MPSEKASKMTFSRFWLTDRAYGTQRNRVSPNQHVVKDPHARRRSNPEIATNPFAQTEQPFCKHEANCFTKIVLQSPSGPRSIKHIRSPLLKTSAPLLHLESGRFRATHRLKFDAAMLRFEPLQRGETDHRSLFYLIFGLRDWIPWI